MNSPKNIAVIGLGAMGFGIASSLLKSPHTIWVFDIDQTKVHALVARGGIAGDLGIDAAQFDIVLTVVLNHAQTESVLFGQRGIVPRMKQGAVVISCATVPPGFAQKASASCLEHDILYLDAPISGGTVKALEGRLSIMASGPKAAFEAAGPALEAIAETVFNLGEEPGKGSAMKMVNQLLAGVHIAAMGEAITFGMAQGLTPEKILKVISDCAGTSWMFENRAPHIIEGDYTPHSAINIWPKDLGIVMDMAREKHLSVPLAKTALGQFIAAAESGLGAEDDAAVAKVYAQTAGISLPQGKGPKAH